MKIKLCSIFVENQDKALDFYTKVLGFVKKTDIPLGDFKWLTVVSPEGHDDVELLLEPNANPAAQTYQKSIFAQGIPVTSFFVNGMQKEYSRLSKLGVVFQTAPMAIEGGPTIAVFDDTCGNLIQLVED